MKNLLIVLGLLLVQLTGSSQQVPQHFIFDDGQNWKTQKSLEGVEGGLLIYGGIVPKEEPKSIHHLQPGLLVFNTNNNQFETQATEFPGTLAIIDKVFISEAGYIGFGRTQLDSLGFSNLMIFHWDNAFNLIFEKVIEFDRTEKYLGHVNHFIKTRESFLIGISESESPNCGIPIKSNIFLQVSRLGEIEKSVIFPTLSIANDISTLAISDNNIPYFSLVGYNGTETIFSLDESLHREVVFSFPKESTATPNNDGQLWSFARGSNIFQDTLSIGIRHKSISLNPQNDYSLFSVVRIPLEDTTQWYFQNFGTHEHRHVIYNYEKNPINSNEVIVGANGFYPPYDYWGDENNLIIGIIGPSKNILYNYTVSLLGEIRSRSINFSDTSTFIIGQFYSNENLKYYSPIVIRINDSVINSGLADHTWNGIQLSVYPNPIGPNGTLTITGSETSSIRNVRLFNSLGKEFECNWNKDRIQLDGFMPGIYILAFETPEGIITQRIEISQP